MKDHFDRHTAAAAWRRNLTALVGAFYFTVVPKLRIDLDDAPVRIV